MNPYDREARPCKVAAPTGPHTCVWGAAHKMWGEALLFPGEGKCRADTERVHHRKLPALPLLFSLVSQPPKHVPTRNSPPAPTLETKEVGGECGGEQRKQHIQGSRGEREQRRLMSRMQLRMAGGAARCEAGNILKGLGQWGVPSWL